MKKYKPFIVAALIVLTLWSVNWFLVKNENRGTLGDMFGVVNSLFTGLSFAGIIYAMYLQNQELSLQRKELRDTRNVMKDQSETLKLQTSETTFFRLLENHRSLVSSLTFNTGTGYVGLNGYYHNLRNTTEEYYGASFTGHVYKKQIFENYPLNTFKYQNENIEQFVENITHVIKLIEHKLNNDNFYHETFFNSLSKAEKYILGFYIYNIKPERLQLFNGKNFNYLQFFEGSGNAFFIDKKVSYFPNLHFQLNRSYVPFSLIDLLNGRLPEGSGNMKISFVENIKGGSAILKSIAINVQNDDGKMKSCKNFDLELHEGVEINIDSEIRESVFSQFIDFTGKRNLHKTYCKFFIDFEINYNNKDFIYRLHYTAQHIRQDDNSGLQILES